MKEKIIFDNFEETEKVNNKIDEMMKNIETDKKFSLVIEFYNKYLSSKTMLSPVSYEIKKEFLLFLRKVKEHIIKEKYPVNRVYLLGNKQYEDEGTLTLILEESGFSSGMKTVIWPDKEVFLYDGGKRILDSMLDSSEIDIEEYELRLEHLKKEFGIIDKDDSVNYLN